VVKLELKGLLEVHQLLEVQQVLESHQERWALNQELRR
jgi:hypothetical protein